MYDEVRIEGNRADCTIERLGAKWKVRIEKEGDSLTVQGPGAGAIETATSLVEACMRRI